MSEKFTDLDHEALDNLIERVTEAKEHELALSPDDCQLLLDALMTLANLQEQMACSDITIGKLRKLSGIIASSERLKSNLSKPGQSGKKTNKKRRKPKTASVKPAIIHHPLDEWSKGDICPQCTTGKLYKFEPATLLRITGQSPFTPEQHIMERLRCNACGAYFTAKVSDEVLADGKVTQKYGYSARSIIAINKYGMGSPFYRQESLQVQLGVPITASTQFDQVEQLANDITPVFYALTRLAADGVKFYLDDTTKRILQAKPVEKKCRNSNNTRLRSGVYTSGLIAQIEVHEIVLFKTNIGHAGEFIDEILTPRAQALPAPILMSDALSHNQPTVCQVKSALCNSHARRQFYDVYSHFTEEVEDILARYKQIWIADDEALEQGLTEKERLAYHQTHSLPVMESIKQWGEKHLADETVEENSGLGKAITYFLKHYQELIAFCRIEGAPLDNNRIESQLKLIVRDRKNAMFHQTEVGAGIADIITSMIATCSLSEVNVFEYLQWLQRESETVKVEPEKYLPWCYSPT